MKPFQFYLVKNFPKPAVGKSLSNHVQLTFSGQTEDVATVITLEAENFEGELDLLRIQSEIRHQTFGFIKPFIGVGREKIEFNEYLQPVDFRAYFHRTLNLMIFEAPKKTCKGIINHLKEKPCGLELGQPLPKFRTHLDWRKTLPHASHFTFAGAWRNLAVHDSSVFYSLGHFIRFANRRTRGRG